MQSNFSNDGNWQLTGNNLYFLYKGDWHFVFTSYKIKTVNIGDARNKYSRFIEASEKKLSELHRQAYLKA